MEIHNEDGINSRCYCYSIPEADILYYDTFLSDELISFYFETVYYTFPFIKTPSVLLNSKKMYCRFHDSPQSADMLDILDNLYNPRDIQYQFTDELSTLKNNIETVSKCRYNSCEVNLYPDGANITNWSFDDTRQVNSYIALLNIGADRYLNIGPKHVSATSPPFSLPIKNGSLVLMSTDIHKRYRYRVKADAVNKNAYISLVFSADESLKK